MAPAPGMFDAITLPKGGSRAGLAGMPGMGGSGADPRQPLRVGLSYDNEYGTSVGLSGDPVTRNVGLEAQFPVGGHRSGFGISAQGGWSPETGVNASLRFGKTNRAVPEDAEVQAILAKHMDRARAYGVPMTPELRSELSDAAYSQADDLANGIGVPGKEKYGFGLTLNGRQMTGADVKGAGGGLAPRGDDAQNALGELIMTGLRR